MKTKKNEKYNLENKRPVFFWIGMILSLVFVITAFEWKSVYDTEIMKRSDVKDEIPELIPITEHDEPKPPKPKKLIAPNPIETTEIDELDSIDIIFDFVDISDEALDSMLVDVEDEVDDNVYDLFVLEKGPSPKGGLDAFYTYVGKNVKYPTTAQRLGVEGRVFVQFIIDKDGKLTELEVIKGIGAGCNEEALRVLKLAPAWNPGKQRGKPVKVRMVLPITFKLN